MTLTELKYIVAVAREKHFGKAAEACFVSQPTLSVAVKKLEDELELKLFERSSGEITVTALGEAIVRQGNGVVSVTFARQGRLSRLYAPATVILPFETSQGTEIVLDFSPDELPVCVVK